METAENRLKMPFIKQSSIFRVNNMSETEHQKQSFYKIINHFFNKSVITQGKYLCLRVLNGCIHVCKNLNWHCMKLRTYLLKFTK